jgi:hypothetical protein
MLQSCAVIKKQLFSETRFQQKKVLITKTDGAKLKLKKSGTNKWNVL